jgi:hypothetical protein
VTVGPHIEERIASLAVAATERGRLTGISKNPRRGSLVSILIVGLSVWIDPRVGDREAPGPIDAKFTRVINRKDDLPGRRAAIRPGIEIARFEGRRVIMKVKTNLKAGLTWKMQNVAITSYSHS